MTSTPTIELRGLTKRFGSVLANAEVNLKVQPGSIHAIVGENGAGKSTAMKMLYGMIRPDAGEIWIQGERKKWRTPSDAIACGIGMVHQHFMLAGPYSALENIWVGDEPFSSRLKWIPRFLRPVSPRLAREKLEEISHQYGLRADWGAPVETLPVGVQQRIEIIKLLYRNASVLILDEPTAVLTPQETTEFLTHLRKLKAEHKTVLIITHKLKEVLGFADRVTVMRGGQVIAQRETSETNAEELATLMVGRKVNLIGEVPPPPHLGPVALEVSNLRWSGVRGVSLKVHGGEVVGIAGVEGNGQSDLLQAILQTRDDARTFKGSIRFFGQEITRGWSTDKIKAMGVGIIPEDRHREGLLLEESVAENLLLGLQRRKPFARSGFLDRRAWMDYGKRALDEYDVRPRSLDAKAGRLSGGNQQKVVIAREFEHQPRLLVAAQPTRGVDVGAIEFIHGKIMRARAEGAGVLLVSSELDEILTLSDRILVLYGGKIAGEFMRDQCTEAELGLRMGGAASP